MIDGVSQKTYRLIGRVVVAWGLAEASMQNLLWIVLDVPPEDGRPITSRFDASTLIPMLLKIGERYLTGDRFLRVADALDRLEHMRPHRNLVVHGRWGLLLPDLEPCAASLRYETDNPSELLIETFPERRLRDLERNILDAKCVLSDEIKSIVGSQPQRLIKMKRL
jgi:hypothetical protein